MSFQSPPPQSLFLYERRWAEDTVNVFISILMDAVKNSKWDVKGDNFHSVEAAFNFVNIMMEKDYSWDEVTSLMCSLRKRFAAFTLVLETPSIRWDRTENFVYATTEVWQTLFEKNNFTKAYYHKGDAMYDNLVSLFSSGVPTSTEVITISSEGPGKRAFNSAHFSFLIPDSDDDQEVESPVSRGRKPPRKQLFPEEGSATCHALVSVESQSTKDKEVVKHVRDTKVIFGRLIRKPPKHLLGGGSTSTVKNPMFQTDKIKTLYLSSNDNLI